MAENRLKEVLAFVNHKGGVGKTTSVQNLAAGLRRYGKGHFGQNIDGKERKPRILLIDLDPQSSLSFLFGWSETANRGLPTMYDALVEQKQVPIYQVREGVYLSPASKRLISIEPFLNQRAVPRKALYKLLSKPLALMTDDGGDLASDGIDCNASFGEAVCDYANNKGMVKITDAFDFVLIDCPPALSLLTYNALTAASSAVLPVQLEPLATKGIAEIINAIKETREDLNEDLAVRGLLMVMSNDQTKATKKFKNYLIETFGDYVFDAYTRRDTKMVEAQSLNKDIFEYAPYCRVGIDYEQLTKEILESMPE